MSDKVKGQTSVQQLEQFEHAIDKALANEGLEDGIKAGLTDLKSWIADLRTNAESYPDVFGTGKSAENLANLLERLSKGVLGLTSGFGAEFEKVQESIKAAGSTDKLSAVEKKIGDLETLVKDALPAFRGKQTPPKKDEEETNELTDEEKANECAKSVMGHEKWTSASPTFRLQGSMLLGELKFVESFQKLKPEDAIEHIKEAMRHQ